MNGFGGIPPSLLRYLETMQRLQPMVDVAKLTEPTRAVVASLEPLIWLQNAFTTSVGPTYEKFAEISMQWKAMMGPVFERMADATRYVNTATRFCAVMLQLGWPPPLGVPTRVMEEIISAYDEQGAAVARDTADRRMLEWYNADVIGEMAVEWESNPLLTRRMPVLRQVVAAHRDGQYSLAVPTVLAQLEGLVADGFHHHGRMSGRHYEVHLDKLLGAEDATWTDSLAKQFILEIVLVNFHHGEPVPSSLSRHAILHGADTEYGTATNSLKALLLFAYLQASFRDLSADQGSAERC